MNEILTYRDFLPLREQRLPNQREQRAALERRIGDWFLVKQPRNKTFKATHQLHTRGIWTEQTRRDILKRIRDSARLSTQERDKLLSDLWKQNNMGQLKVSLDELRRVVRRAQDSREPVIPEVNRRIDQKYPGAATMLRLQRQNRIVNRGNAHTEIRSESPDGKTLIGWTLDTPGVMVQFLRDGNLETVGRNKLLEFGERVRVPGQKAIQVDRIQVQKKSPQPLVWLTLVTKGKPTFEAEIGQVGATAATAGRFEFLTGGGDPFRKGGRGQGFSVVYGVRRSNFHEQFHLYEDPAFQKRVGGRWVFRLLRLGGREDLPEGSRWLARRTDDPAPFIFSNDWESEVAQARRERTDLFWNADAIPTLERLGYFKTFDLEDKLAEFKKSDRGKPPPRGGMARFRPSRRSTKRPGPDIFGD